MWNHLSVDIWFLFGSFAYACESLLHSISSDGITLSIRTKNIDEEVYLKKFIHDMLQLPKGLLRIDLRVYLDDQKTLDKKIVSPVCLYSEAVPKSVTPQNTQVMLQTSFLVFLKLGHLHGFTTQDNEQWTKLVRQLSMTSIADNSANS